MHSPEIQLKGGSNAAPTQATPIAMLVKARLLSVMFYL